MERFAHPGNNKSNWDIIQSGMTNFNQLSNGPASVNTSQEEEHYVCWYCGYTNCDGRCVEKDQAGMETNENLEQS